MKWNKKGHEYDGMYKEIGSKNSFYIFGAGDYGRIFYEFMKSEITIKSIIDNGDNKVLDNIECVKLDEIKLQPCEGIIITMSQFARISAVENLEQLGYRRGIDFFMIEEFFSVYFAYKYNKVYLLATTFLPSTVCNLKCKNCLNFNPYAKNFYKKSFEDAKKDVDLYFKCIDKVMVFHISGGEPMLYDHTAELIQYIHKNYGDKIIKYRTITNGTVKPSEDILIQLSNCNIELILDDYRESLPQFRKRFEEIEQLLKKYKVQYRINKVDSWVNIYNPEIDYSNESYEWLINHRDTCNQSWQELKDGYLYSCSQAAYAVEAGIAGSIDIEEKYDLRNFTKENAKELVEFSLGYSNSGFTNFCKKCKGFRPNNSFKEKPAEQCD